MPSEAKSSKASYRQIKVIYHPWNTGRTTVTVFTTDFAGAAGVSHRIGSIILPGGREVLAGLSAPAVTESLTSRLLVWLSEHRDTMPAPAASPPRARSAPAPLEGPRGAAVDPLRTDPLPGV